MGRIATLFNEEDLKRHFSAKLDRIDAQGSIPSQEQ